MDNYFKSTEFKQDLEGLLVSAQKAITEAETRIVYYQNNGPEVAYTETVGVTDPDAAIPTNAERIQQYERLKLNANIQVERIRKALQRLIN